MKTCLVLFVLLSLLTGVTNAQEICENRNHSLWCAEQEVSGELIFGELWHPIYEGTELIGVVFYARPTDGDMNLYFYDLRSETSAIVSTGWPNEIRESWLLFLDVEYGEADEELAPVETKLRAQILNGSDHSLALDLDVNPLSIEWSPDGRHIALKADGIYLIDFDPVIGFGNVVQVGNAVDFVWLADGALLTIENVDDNRRGGDVYRYSPYALTSNPAWVTTLDLEEEPWYLIRYREFNYVSVTTGNGGRHLPLYDYLYR